MTLIHMTATDGIAAPSLWLRALFGGPRLYPQATPTMFFVR